jgi:hypothetical protein
MCSKVRSHLSYANVVSTMCLFIVLGGTSYAVATGSIDSREIKNSTIRGKDVKNNSLKGSDVAGLGTGDIRDSSLLAQDFKPGQLPAGATGASGARGPEGPPGISGLDRVGKASPSNSQSPKFVLAVCPPGQRVVGTGADIEGGKTGTGTDILTSIVIDEIEPSHDTVVPGTVGVTAIEEEPTAESWSVQAYALCANVG